MPRQIPIPPKSELEHKCLIEQKTLHAIGIEYGCSSGTIRKWLHRYGIIIVVKNSYKYDTFASKEVLNKLYTIDGYSLHRVANMYGVSATFVRDRLTDYNIPIHKAGYAFNQIPLKEQTRKILNDLVNDLKDDPESLSTKFLQDFDRGEL